jgi:hypothetical protein
MSSIPNDQPGSDTPRDDKASGGREPRVHPAPNDKVRAGTGNPQRGSAPVPDAIDLGPDDELLSAYLDGELPADERQRVERLLADQPESRQLLDELRALGGTLAVLPRHRLESDFAARVLRAAERTMLSGDASDDDDAPHSSGGKQSAARDANGRSREDVKPVPASQHEAVWSTAEAGWSWQRARRPMSWLAVVLAASLLIMFVERSQVGGPRNHVAFAPKEETAKRAGGLEVSAPNVDRRLPPDSFGFRGEVSPGDRSPGYRAADQVLDAVPSEAKEFSRGVPDHELPDAPAAGTLGDMPAAPPPPSSRAGVAQRSFGSSLGAGGFGGGGANPAAGGLQLPETLDELQGRLSSLGSEQWQAAARDPSLESLLVLECEVPSNVVDRREFQQILADNNIVLERALEDAREEANAAASEVPSDGAETQPKKAGANSLAPADAFRYAAGFDDENDPQRTLAFIRLAEGQADGLLVEGSQEQLEGLVADLQRHPEVIYSLAVEPAPKAPEQEALTTFNRARETAFPLGLPADEPAPSDPSRPAPSADEAPKAKAAADKSEAGDKGDADDKGDSGERADPLENLPVLAKDMATDATTLGRALRLETRKAASLGAVSSRAAPLEARSLAAESSVAEKEGVPGDDVKLESAKAGNKVAKPGDTRASRKRGEASPAAPAAEPAKTERLDDAVQGATGLDMKRRQPAGAESTFREKDRSKEQRRGLDRETARRRALLILRPVAPAASEPAAEPKP